MAAKHSLEGKLKALLKKGCDLQKAAEELCSCKASRDCQKRILKILRGEMRFLSRISHDLSKVEECHVSSSNLAHVEALLACISHPAFHGVTAVLHDFHDPISSERCQAAKEGESQSSNTSSSGRSPAFVDLICMYARQPAWIFVSAANTMKQRQELKISARQGPLPVGELECNSSGGDTQSSLIHRLRTAKDLTARGGQYSGQVQHFIVYLHKGLEEGLEAALRDEFGLKRWAGEVSSPPSQQGQCQCYKGGRKDSTVGVLRGVGEENSFEDDDWVKVDFEEILGLEGENKIPAFDDDEKKASEKKAAWLHVCICPTRLEHRQRRYIFGQDGDRWNENHINEKVEERFSVENTKAELMEGVRCEVRKLAPGIEGGGSLLNLDTTALMALVSELTNGDGAELLHSMSSEDFERRFRNTSEFMRSQIERERKEPLLQGLLKNVMEGRKLIVCQSAWNEFLDIVSVVGGRNEQERAEALSSRLSIVPDNPSDRFMGLSETARIKRRHKIVFGTGDSMLAPTLTANHAFIRAVQQIRSVPISFFLHPPCALIGL